ncbi:Light-regulated signal transduction histidine kinase (Bacteriophytochrome) [Hyphomicrobiales bacterium]|nr:Light-regulated signal transduction histidine kinase (Bacteriophytochrome) [Hyphomicrobiales bacterium]CAH1681465.1 Light-regulated signal transduction histidine kinase (Bacteriophytochrome) [Hyphomicrobiales bacterium]
MPSSRTLAGRAFSVDLTNCDREPIHIPGSIQPHGCLLACDVNAAVVLRHSRNAADMLGLQKTELVNAHLDDILGARVTHALRNALTTSSGASRPSLLFDVALADGRRFDVAVHRYKATVIIEFEPTQTVVSPLELARQLISRISDVTEVNKLIDKTSKLVRALLGYDRVMIYRFEQDGAGKVVSEAKRADLESFLGQYFPAGDIPQQARELYLRNTIRIISDASGHRVPVVPELDPSGEPLDLSFAHLRSVSPVHCEYLRNMGVAASMSISVIIDGRLWGLIACHHYAPRVLPMAQRVSAEMFGEFFSLHLHVLKQKRKLESATAARDALDRFLQAASHYADIESLLRDNLPDFMRLMPCNGVGLWMNGTWNGYGTTPPLDALPEITRFIGEVAEGKVWATHALSQRLPSAADYHEIASGILAIPLSQTPRDYLFFFRKEFVQTLEWAGNPEKSYETGPLGDRLTPRRSFAIWKETVRHQSQPWTEADREIAEAARIATVEVVLRHNEMMADERNKADVRQRMLNEELNHRVKNILAVIKSIVSHPSAEELSLTDYVLTLKGRIQALAFAHDQIVRSNDGGMLLDLITAELSPYQRHSAEVTLEGPAVWLDNRSFSVMALVLHELATNAAKYGSLSSPNGKLLIRWSLDQDGDFALSWSESGGPEVKPPSRRGFGTALINRSIPYDLGGRSAVSYNPKGLHAEFVLPARHVRNAADSGPASGNILPMGIEIAHAAFAPDVEVLVVEDQMLIAMDVENILDTHGVTNVVITSSSSEALAKLNGLTPDVAVLDVNLGEGTSIPVADELSRRGIPFVFATGYGDSAMIPAIFSDVPVVRKPYDGQVLVGAMRTVMART